MGTVAWRLKICRIQTGVSAWKKVEVVMEDRHTSQKQDWVSDSQKGISDETMSETTL